MSEPSTTTTTTTTATAAAGTGSNCSDCSDCWSPLGFGLGVLFACLVLIVPLILAVVWSGPALNHTWDTELKTATCAMSVAGNNPKVQGSPLELRPGTGLADLHMDNRLTVLRVRGGGSGGSGGSGGCLFAALEPEKSRLWQLEILESGFAALDCFAFQHNGCVRLLRVKTSLPGFSVIGLSVTDSGLVVVSTDMYGVHTVGENSSTLIKCMDCPEQRTFTKCVAVLSTLYYETEHYETNQRELWKLDLADLVGSEFVQVLSQAPGRLVTVSGEHALYETQSGSFVVVDLETQHLLFNSQTQTHWLDSNGDLLSWSDGRSLKRHILRAGRGTDVVANLEDVVWVRCARGLLVIRTKSDYVLAIKCTSAGLMGLKKPDQVEPREHEHTREPSLYYFPTVEQAVGQPVEQPATQEPRTLGFIADNKLMIVFDSHIDVLGLLSAFWISEGARFVGFASQSSVQSSVQSGVQSGGHGQTTMSTMSTMSVHTQGPFDKTGFVHETGEKFVADRSNSSLYFTFSELPVSRSVDWVGTATSASVLTLH